MPGYMYPAVVVTEEGHQSRITPGMGDTFTPGELLFLVDGSEFGAVQHAFVAQAAVVFAPRYDGDAQARVNATASAGAGRPVYGPAVICPKHLLPNPDDVRPYTPPLH